MIEDELITELVIPFPDYTKCINTKIPLFSLIFIQLYVCMLVQIHYFKKWNEDKITKQQLGKL